ncbi:MAG: hypothetical protein H6581_26000 [Bacteroidia bacterium]|nr:hypothetical protein [Bacteroidia bacterium]
MNPDPSHIDPHQLIQGIIRTLPASEQERVGELVNSADSIQVINLYRELVQRFLNEPALQHEVMEGIISPAVSGLQPPPGLYESGGRFFTKWTKIEFVVVPAGVYQLGAEEAVLSKSGEGLQPNPVREVKLEAPFWIMSRPLYLVQGSGMVAPDSDTDPSGDFLVQKIADAIDLRAEIAELEDLNLGFPTGDQWEMAARGTDGRPLPWGRAGRLGFLDLPSPCGALNMIGVVPQWTAEQGESGQHIFCGHPDWRHAACRMEARDKFVKAGLRFVVLP